MNTQRQETDEILNELTSIEFDDDDALTLLDDEEATPVSRETIDDEDLASFYLDSSEETPKKTDLYTEKEVPNVPVQKEEVKVAKEIKEETPVQTPVSALVSQPSTPEKYYGGGAHIDAYLNGSLENRKEEVKVERVTQTPPKPEPISSPTPQVQVVTPSEKKEEPVDMNNLNQLFAKVSNNVRGASDIVNKNAEIKKKIDERFQEIKRLQDAHEEAKKKDYAEINAYKDEVYAKLKDKKNEVEEQMALLKKEQQDFETQKQAFAKEKEETLARLAKKDQELMLSYQERVKSIEQIENGLVKRKEQLDSERATIQQEKEQCEKDKKELAENLIKFNQLVDDFTKGVDRFNETN